MQKDINILLIKFIEYYWYYNNLWLEFHTILLDYRKAAHLSHLCIDILFAIFPEYLNGIVLYSKNESLIMTSLYFIESLYLSVLSTYTWNEIYRNSSLYNLRCLFSKRVLNLMLNEKIIPSKLLRVEDKTE